MKHLRYILCGLLLLCASQVHATEQFQNVCSTTLSAAISSTSATTFTVNSTSCGALGGTFPTTGTYSVAVDNELMTVSGVSGTTFTVSRGESGTTAATHANGATVTVVLSARAMAQLESDLEAVSLQVGNNLSDLSSPSTARTNLGLGSSATENLPQAGLPGNYASLEQIKTDVLPATLSTLTCLNPSGSYPDNHWYSGTLSGNVTWHLSNTACVDNAVISVTTVQDAAHTVAFDTTAAGGIEGPGCPTLGTVAGNQETWQFKYNAARTSWVQNCIGTVPWTAPAVSIASFVDAGSPYPPLSSDQDIDCNCSSGACTVNLPAAGNQALKRDYIIKNLSTNQNCNVHPNGTDTIDGVNSNVVLTQNQVAHVHETGSGTWDRVSEVALGGDLSSTPSNAFVGKIRGETLSNPPALVNTQYFAAGATSLSIPSGSTYCDLIMCSGGAGGGGVVTGGGQQCSGASGSSGECSVLALQTALMTYSNPLTISVGTGGNAGANSATTPSAGSNGNNTSITINGLTLTDTGATAAGGAENSACNATTGTGTGGGGLGIGSQLPVGVSLRSNTGGSNGTAGTNTKGTPQFTSIGNAGGDSGSNTSGNVAVAPLAGRPGFITLNCTGATVW